MVAIEFVKPSQWLQMVRELAARCDAIESVPTWSRFVARILWSGWMVRHRAESF